MIYFRSSLYLLILLLITPPYAIFVILCGVLPRLARWRVISWWPIFATWLARWLLGIRYVVEGRENIPREPCVILSKHQSAWETIAYSGIFPPHVYVLKRELFWIPFLGWGLALYSPIGIDRTNRKAAMQRVVEQGNERFEQGFSIMMYPEGTRVAVGARRAYRVGGAVLAKQLGARVLPVAHNAGLVWPRNSFLKYPGKVTVRIGTPIESTDKTPEQLMRQVEEWVETQVAELVAHP
jgi:1-acyl-sn-glycerol-3-phosphate acyltransferase